MNKTQCATRALALDLRLQRCGFAVLEGAAYLLEWGVRTYQTADGRDLPEKVLKRVSPLISFFAPSVVIIKPSPAAPHRPDYSRSAAIFETITSEAQRQSITWAFVEREEIRRAFGLPVRAKKYEIAARVSLCFPELTWKLPPERKFYKSEHPGMAVFDAVSVGLTYFARSGQVHPSLKPDRQMLES